jgi:tetratricopeptide (TPR) repeat protein
MIFVNIIYFIFCFRGDSFACSELSNFGDTNDYYTNAVKFSNEGKYRHAIRSYTKYLKTHISSKNAYWGRALSYYYLGKYSKAIRDYSFALIADKENDTIYHDRGVAFYALGDYTSAASDFKLAINLNPQDTSYYVSLISALKKQNDTSGILTTYNEAILETHNIYFYYDRAEILYYIKKFQAAAYDFKTVSTVVPNYGNATFFIGMCHLNIQNIDSALIYFAKAKANHANQNGILDYELGICYGKQERYPESVIALTDAINIDPENGSYYYQRGLSYFALGNHEQACSDMIKSGKLGVKEALDFKWKNCP